MVPNEGPPEPLVLAANGGGAALDEGPDPNGFDDAGGAALGVGAPNGFAPVGGLVPKEGADGLEDELSPKAKGLLGAPDALVSVPGAAAVDDTPGKAGVTSEGAADAAGGKGNPPGGAGAFGAARAGAAGGFAMELLVPKPPNVGAAVDGALAFGCGAPPKEKGGFGVSAVAPGVAPTLPVPKPNGFGAPVEADLGAF